MMSKPESEETRIDKFLWSVRIYKSRSIAADACRNNRVTVNSVHAKSSRTVSPGDMITVRKMPVIYSYRVIDIPRSRVGAPLVKNYLEDLTPPEERSKIEVKAGLSTGYRQRGSGRPTKKERRSIDRLREGDAD